MNVRQKTVVCLGVVVIVAMVLCPPWVHWTWGIGRPSAPPPPGLIRIPEVRIRTVRYAPIFNRPVTWNAPLDVRRLLIQCAVVVGVTGILVVKCRDG